ncbi:helix-turn-helix domain-containing protein, partial [Pseudomonas fluorescens]
PDDFFVDLEMNEPTQPAASCQLDGSEDLNQLLRAAGGNISHLARHLGVSRNTLYKRLRKSDT